VVDGKFSCLRPVGWVDGNTLEGVNVATLTIKGGNMRNFSHLKAIHLLSLLQRIRYPGNA
jgi:hypothetical protein